MIIGRNVQCAFGVKLDFENHCIVCDEVSAQICEFPANQKLHQLSIHCRIVLTTQKMMWLLPEPVDAHAVVDSHEHPTPEQWEDSHKLLTKFNVLFDDKLKTFTDEKTHLNIDKMMLRIICVPVLPFTLFKTKLSCLVEEDVLEKCGRATRVARTFIVLKKHGSEQLTSDFRAPDKALKCKHCPLQKISKILFQCKGCKLLPKLDLPMQSCVFERDDKSKNLCAIAAPCRLFCHKCLPMGASSAPGIAQEIMECVLAPLLEELEVCLDGIAAFSDDWDSHLILLEKTLTILQGKCFTINPAKCEWGVQETDFIGHWLMTEGLKL